LRRDSGNLSCHAVHLRVCMATIVRPRRLRNVGLTEFIAYNASCL
jgi:hypothetical protein